VKAISGAELWGETNDERLSGAPMAAQIRKSRRFMESIILAEARIFKKASVPFRRFFRHFRTLRPLAIATTPQ
jgi:hypothetical protein